MILDVPYYSQFKDTHREEWKTESCGIVALKMVLDFYQPTNLTVDELYQKGLEIGGYIKKVGWYHHKLANLAQTLGFLAATRSWNIPKESLQHLVERGFRQEDIDLITNQQLEEGIFTLKREVDLGHPVIVPLPRGFVEGGPGHLAVLVGYDEEGFILHDPDDTQRPGEKVKLTYDQFKKMWGEREKRAIVIVPQK